MVDSTALMSRSHHLSFVFNGIMGLTPSDSTADILDIQMKKWLLVQTLPGFRSITRALYGKLPYEKNKLTGEPMFH